MPDFKDLNSLFKHLNKNCLGSALKREGAETVTKEMSETIKDVTYNEYDPSEYVRRMDGGGISDVRNYTVEIIGDNTISITNDATGADDDFGKPLDEIIVSGTGYTWKNSGIYKMQPYPRDFYSDTVERLKNNGKHVEAIRTGLKRQGVDVR
ncbi:hypothetical protein [Paenibacillus xylaniclasticus]|uniref:hypothetical protein n=1 Tax=Paenibacillus xylaniclasticus TaxID=588083 RepID=UPI000FDC108E|nr:MULTISPECIES: hypothetical protein [Paenibacillus]